VSERVVYLAFRNENTTVGESLDFVACKHCRNKTYTLTHDSNEFPLMKCAACGAHIGRIGWAD
jgi:ribosomal protein S27E